MARALVWCLVSAMLLIRMVRSSSQALLCGVCVVTFAAISWLIALSSFPVVALKGNGRVGFAEKKFRFVNIYYPHDRNFNNMTCFCLSGNHQQIQQTEVDKLQHPYSGHSGQTWSEP